MGWEVEVVGLRSEVRNSRNEGELKVWCAPCEPKPNRVASRCHWSAKGTDLERVVPRTHTAATSFSGILCAPGGLGRSSAEALELRSRQEEWGLTSNKSSSALE